MVGAQASLAIAAVLRRAGVTEVWATHDRAEAVADRILQLDDLGPGGTDS